MQYVGVAPGASCGKLRYVVERLIVLVKKVICHDRVGVLEVIQDRFFDILRRFRSAKYAFHADFGR